MLATVTEFPHPGSRGYVLGTCDPVTIIRHNAPGADGTPTALVRRDPRSGELRNRDASGNTTLPLAEIFETEAEAFDASLNTKRAARTRKPRRARAGA